ncbi:protease complex subunit PrcB family protein [Brevibacillus daliensis]|uniref:protease complex subunit PrcB family protein n=1 Tax=Brevibacillus daliensis TaxID=2892995 RepID=UPI001E6474D9|nr:protease complex subunit PrcB family protein [Brevibacillus daliensis]
MKYICFGAFLLITSIFPVNSSTTIDGVPAAVAKTDQAKGVSSMIDYSIANPPYSPKVESALTALEEDGVSGYRVVYDEEKDTTFVAIALGERPTSGYSINVNQVEQAEDGSLTIRVSEQRPQSGMQLQVLTYPTLVLQFPGQVDQVNVLF